MRTKPTGIQWLALDFLWCTLAGFALAFTTPLAEGIVLSLALVFTLAKCFFFSFVFTSSLIGGLAGGLANVLAGNFLGEKAGHLATAIALVVCLAWIAPGVLSAVLTVALSLGAALIWAKSTPLATVLGTVCIGAGAGIVAVILSEIVGRARNELLTFSSQRYTAISLTVTSLAGAAFGTVIGYAANRL